MKPWPWLVVNSVVLMMLAGACSSSEKKSTGWSNVGGTEVAPNRAFGGKLAVSNGVPYAAFQDYSVDGKLSVMKLAGAKWVDVGVPGFTPDVVDSFVVYVDNGTPFVAFTMYDSTGSNEILNVMKFDGVNWTSVGNANFAIVGYGPFSLLVSAGVPYVAFSDLSNGLHVQTVSAGAWVELSGALVSNYGKYPTLGMHNGALALAYSDSSGADGDVLTLVTYTGAAWTLLATSALTINTSYGADATLVDSSGSLYFIFENYTYGPVVLKLVGGALQSVGTLGSISNGDEVEYISGVVYNGVPYVAFDDEARDSDPNPRAATVKYFNGTSWTLYGDYPNTCDIEDTYLAVDAVSGGLYLTYSDCQGGMTVQVR